MNPHDRTLRAAPVRFAAVYLIAILLAPLIAVTMPRGLAPWLIAASVIGTVMFRLRSGPLAGPIGRWMLITGRLSGLLCNLGALEHPTGAEPAADA